MDAGELVQKLDERVRGQAHNSTLMLRVISKVQQIVNAGMGVVRETATLSTLPYMQLYDIRDSLPNQAGVRAVLDNGVYDAERLQTWRELLYWDRRWFRRVAQRFESFITMGYDLLIVHPGKVIDSTATVVYTKLTLPLAVLSDPVEMPAEQVAIIVDVAEALLLLRERRFESLTPLLKQMGL